MTKGLLSTKPWRVVRAHNTSEMRWEILDGDECPVALFILSQDAEMVVNVVNGLGKKSRARRGS